MQNNKLLASIFLIAIIGIPVLYYFSPSLSDKHKQQLFIWPQNPSQLKKMIDILLIYNQDNKSFIIGCFIYMYLFLQSFAIPGAVFLSMISGALFGGIPGFLISQTCATIGSCICFLLSLGLGRGLINRIFSKPLQSLKQRIKHHKHNLFWYMLFLRMTPLVPNWFVNLSSGHVGIPLSYFFLATAIGLTPNNVILVRTGLALSEFTHFGFRIQNFLLLLFLGTLSLLPTLFKKKLQQFEQKIQ